MRIALVSTLAARVARETPGSGSVEGLVWALADGCVRAGHEVTVFGAGGSFPPGDFVATLPGPFGVVTPVADCAAALVDAIDRRRRKVFVPKSLAPLAAVRQLFASPLAERLTAAMARRRVPELEAESARLGSAFGASSVEHHRL